ncbi:uncharacterized protein LOC125681173 isoform X2 [Ostrea edulis]|uniref:uncharacterized protein LOC125681173 isoform X2 n=1 Tax=Ostrea edulis TaxID=37623 RepID=UPI0024AEFF35|nr:uncharacterized protein LOC125681173 isoform X2 [Ostrea edulis]
MWMLWNKVFHQSVRMVLKTRFPNVTLFVLYKLYLISSGNCLYYHHMEYQRYIEPASDLTFSSAPTLSILATKLTECLDLCRKFSQCASVFYDESSLNCSVFEGTSDVTGPGKNQRYLVVTKDVLHPDVISYAESLCNAGYTFDATALVCYKIDITPRDKSNAISFCEESDGHLMRIDTYIKQSFAEGLNLKEEEYLCVESEWYLTNC